MVAEGFVVRFPNGAQMFLFHGAHFQAGRHGCIGERFGEISLHVEFITHRDIARAFHQGDGAFLAARHKGLEKVRRVARMFGGDFAQARFPVRQHGRADSLAAPFGQEEPKRGIDARAVLLLIPEGAVVGDHLPVRFGHNHVTIRVTAFEVVVVIGERFERVTALDVIGMWG